MPPFFLLALLAFGFMASRKRAPSALPDSLPDMEPEPEREGESEVEPVVPLLDHQWFVVNGRNYDVEVLANRTTRITIRSVEGAAAGITVNNGTKQRISSFGDGSLIGILELDLHEFPSPYDRLASVTDTYNN
jgi:hypothetical protein